jgi:hypothetical protein
MSSLSDDEALKWFENKGKKKCHKCLEMLSMKAYPPNKGCSDGFAGTCRLCTKKRVERNAAERKKASEAPAHPARPSADSDPNWEAGKSHKCVCGQAFKTYLAFEVHQEVCQMFLTAAKRGA